MKRLTLALAIVAAALVGSVPAWAGGSSFTFDQPSYRPGDRAFAWSTAYDLAQIRRDGPFAAWIVPVGDWTWGGVPAAAVHVGEIVPHTGAYQQSNVLSPNHLTLEFTVPELPPGEYGMVNCNRPCTTSIHEVTWGGSFRILAGAPTPATTSIAPPSPTTVVAAAPLVASSGSGGPPSWFPLVVGSAVVLGFAVVLLLLLGDRRPRQATVKPT